MSALTTRDVLATGLHGLVCTRHASLDECEDAAVYRDDADALIASGVVVDAATLAARIRDVATPVGAPDGSLAYEFWRGYRVAKNEIADVIVNPSLADALCERNF